jgi:hypothetical protein
MKRKDFIQRISFLGVGLSLAPWKLVSAKSSIQIFALPNATVHIPHGNFAASESEKLTISEFNLECAVQQFMRNGIEPNDDDLKIVTFQSGQEWMSISITRNGQTASESQLSGLKITVNSFGDSTFSIVRE